MALIYADRVQEDVSSSGSADFSLNGAITSWQTFSSAIGNNNTCYYCATDGSSWEVGIGTYRTTGNLLERTTILDSSTGAKINFPAAPDVYTVVPASIFDGSQASSIVAGTATNATNATNADNADKLNNQLASYYLARANHTGTDQVSDGGTGRTSLTNNNVLVGNGTSAVTLVPPTVNGYVFTLTGGVPGWASLPAGGGGDVTGPASATDNAIARFDLATGKVIQNSAATVNDGGDIYCRELFPTNDLDVARGGTGVSTLDDGGVMLGNGTGGVQVLAPPAAAGMALASAAGAADNPTWVEQIITTYSSSITDTILASATEYAVPHGLEYPFDGSANRRSAALCPVSGIMKDARAHVITTNTTIAASTVTLMKAPSATGVFADTGISFSIPAGSLTAQNSGSDTASVAAGDWLLWKVDCGAGGNIQDIAFAFTIIADGTT